VFILSQLSQCVNYTYLRNFIHQVSPSVCHVTLAVQLVRSLSDCDSSRLFRDAIKFYVKKFHEIASKLCEFYYFSDIVPRVSLIWLRMCGASVIQLSAKCEQNFAKASSHFADIRRTAYAYSIPRHSHIFLRDICANFWQLRLPCELRVVVRLSCECCATVARRSHDGRVMHFCNSRATATVMRCNLGLASPAIHSVILSHKTDLGEEVQKLLDAAACLLWSFWLFLAGHSTTGPGTGPISSVA